MSAAETFLIFLLVIAVVAYLAQRVGMAYSVAFVISGIALASIPQFPMFEIPPDLLLLLFLPPLLNEAAYQTSLRDLRANMRPILQLAIGLVVATTFGVAYAFNYLAPGMGLGLGFVLGSIISPPDAVAAVSVTRHVRIPRRIMTILEGESLINDATGLVMYKFAVAAVVVGGFSLADASLQFVWMVVSGVSMGWLIGWVFMRIFPHIHEMSVQILSTFLIPYASYLLVENLHGSGVLAVVTTGLTIGWYGPQRFTPAFRGPAVAVWQMVTFVLNGLVFLLIGLHFPGLLRQLHSYDPAILIELTIAASVIAISIRVLWVYIVGYGTRFLFPSIRKNDPYPNWQNMFVIAWTGMRGVVSLATALALPLTVADGWTPFPHRDLIIFLAFSVILVTLVLQGLSLPWLTRKLSLTYEGSILYEQWQARKEAAETAIKRLEELAGDPDFKSPALDRIISHYRDRVMSLGDGPNTPIVLKTPPKNDHYPLIITENRLWTEALKAEREAVVCLRQRFVISDDIMHEMLRDIDLLHNRFANNT